MNLLPVVKRVRKKEFVMNLQKIKEFVVNLQKVKDEEFDSSSLKDVKNLDIPGYCELLLVLKELESESIKENINSKFIEEAKKLKDDISGFEFGIYYSVNNGFVFKYDPRNIPVYSQSEYINLNQMPRLGFDFFIENIDNLNTSSPEDMLESLIEYTKKSLSEFNKNKTNYGQTMYSTSSEKIKRKYSYLEFFRNQNCHQNLKESVLYDFNKAKNISFLSFGETIYLRANIHEETPDDILEEVKKLTKNLWGEHNGDIKLLMRAMVASKMFLEKSDLDFYLESVFLNETPYVFSYPKNSNLSRKLYLLAIDIIRDFEKEHCQTIEKKDKLNKFKLKIIQGKSFFGLYSLYNDLKTEDDYINLFKDLLVPSSILSKKSIMVDVKGLDFMKFDINKLMSVSKDTDCNIEFFVSSFKDDFNEIDAPVRIKNLFLSEKLSSVMNENFLELISNSVLNKKVIVPIGFKDFIVGFLKLSLFNNEKINIIQNNLEEVEPEVLNNLKENYLVL